MNKDITDKNKKSRVQKRIISAVLITVVAAAVFFAGFFTHYISMDESIRTLGWIKKHIEEDYVGDISDEDFLNSAMKGIDDLLDDYSQCYTPDEYIAAADSSAGRKEGMGLSFLLDGDNTLIYRVSGNSPAEKVGIKEGSYLFGFGVSESDITYSCLYNDLSEFLSSAEGEFYLCLAEDKEGNGKRLYKISRESFVENYVFYRSDSSAYRFSGKNALDEESYDGAIPSLDKDTAYIRLNQFAGNAAEQVEKCLEIFKREGKKNLILDLRNNGGGNMDVLQDIASFFVKDAKNNGPLVAVAKYKDGSERNFRAGTNRYKEYFSSDSKIYVLANSNTASASECLIGAIIDYNTSDYSDIYISEYDGEAKTYGKGIMQTTFYMAGTGCAVKLTTAEIYWPVSGRCIHGVGITSADGANAVKADGYVTFDENELLSVIESLK